MIGGGGEGDPGVEVTASVVIATMGRPDHLRSCLSHAARQSLRPVETVVVDASHDERSYEVVVREFPDVRYIRNPFGAGHLATSRRIGVDATSGDVVVFFDDDAYADADCVARLAEVYADPAVGGVGGRVRNGIAGEETAGVDEIGRLLADGTLIGHFAADPGTVIEVDHLLGACMSYRRSALEAIGGIHDHYPGTCLREDADISLRVRRPGYRLAFQPAAFVDHVAGPYPKGRRFDVRYDYYAHRNHAVLLAVTSGSGDRYARANVGVAARDGLRQLRRSTRAVADRGSPPGARLRAVGGGVARAGACWAGLAVGMAAGARARRSPAGRTVRGQTVVENDPRRDITRRPT